MSKPNRLYIRVMAADTDMSWADIAKHIEAISPDVELERHPKGGWSVWLPEETDRTLLAETLDAAGLQIVI